MKKMTSVISSFLVVICFIGLMAGTSHAANKVYKLGITPGWAGWAGFYVAKEKGFWEKRGVNVMNISIDSDNENIEAMKKGLLDLGIVMAGSLVDLNQEGSDIIALAETDWSHGGDKVVVKNGVDLKDLKGKPVGVYLNQTCVTYFFDKYLSTLGMKLSDFKVLEIEDDSALTDKFISGVFSAIVTYDPEAMRAVDDGDGKVAATTESYEGCMPSSIVVSKSHLKSMPKEDLKKILLGYADAAEWLNDPANWKEYQTILNNVVFEDDEEAPFSEEDLKEMVDSVIIHGKKELLERNKAGGGFEAYLKEAGEFLKSNGALKKEFTPADLCDTSILMEALSSN